MLRLIRSSKRRPRTEHEQCACGHTAICRVNNEGVCAKKACIDRVIRSTSERVMVAYRRQFGGAA